MSGAGLVIEGELLEPGPLPDVPGDTLSIPVSRYRVLLVLSGSCPHREILVGHGFQDRMSVPFHPGERHRMELTRDFPEHATILDPFAGREPRLPLYYCRSLSLAG